MAAVRALTPRRRGARCRDRGGGDARNLGVGSGHGAQGRRGELLWWAAERDGVALDTNRLHYGDITLKASFHHTPAACRTAFGLLTSGRFKCAEYITRTARRCEKCRRSLRG